TASLQWIPRDGGRALEPSSRALAPFRPSIDSALGRKVGSSMLASRAFSVLVLAGAVSGCNMTNLAAGSTVQIISKAWPAIERYEDPDLADGGIPASIATMEGLLEIRPEDTELRAFLAQAYGSYAFGFMEDKMEAALVKDDEEGSEHFRKRAAMEYSRGRELAL